MIARPSYSKFVKLFSCLQKNFKDKKKIFWNFMSSQFPEFLIFSGFSVICPNCVQGRGGLSPAPPRTTIFKLVLWSRACNGIYGDSPEWRRISANGDDDGNCFISSATRALILSRLMKRNYYQGTLTSVRLWSFFIGSSKSVWIFGQKSIYLIIGNYFIFLNWSMNAIPD